MAWEKDFIITLENCRKHINDTYTDLLSKFNDNSGDIQNDELKDAKEHLKNLIEQYIVTRQIECVGMTTEDLIEKVYLEMAEFSILTPFIENPEVEEINVNTFENIVVTFAGKKKRCIDDTFMSPSHARDIISKLLRKSNVIIDQGEPAKRGHLSEQVRISALHPPIVSQLDGIGASIRIVNPRNLSFDDLLKFGSLTKEMLEALEVFIIFKQGIMAVGETNAGKTTYLANLMKKAAEKFMRILSVEKGTREFSLTIRDKAGKVISDVLHAVTVESKDKEKSITEGVLTEFFMTMNPDIIGFMEIKSADAIEAIKAGISGHGVAGSIHSDSTRNAYKRFLTLVADKSGLSEKLLMELIIDAFPIAFQCSILADGSRKITEIAECYYDEESEKVHHNMLFEYIIEDTIYDEYDNATVIGEFKQVGTISKKLEKRLLRNGASKQKLKMLLNQVDGTNGGVR